MEQQQNKKIKKRTIVIRSVKGENSNLIPYLFAISFPSSDLTCLVFSKSHLFLFFEEKAFYLEEESLLNLFR